MKTLKKISIGSFFAILLSLIAIATILTAYYLINQTRDNDFEKNMTSINQIQQLNAKWSTAVLTTQSYTLQDFDAVASYIIKIREILESLEEQGFSNPDKLGSQTVTAFQIYKNSFDLKSQAVEHYQSEQAILRNSVIYLPNISEELQAILQLIPDNSSLEKTLMSSNLLINQFLLTTARRQEIRKKLTALENQAQSITEKTKNKIDRYITHASIIIQYKPKVKRMLTRAMNIDFGLLSNNLIQAYNGHQDSLKQRISFLQKTMLAGVFALLIMMLWFLIKLKKSNTKIAKTDAQKEQVEQQLIETEQQVKQVKKDVLVAERHRASSDLVIGTFNDLQMLLPTFPNHIKCLNSLKNNENEKGIESLTRDLQHIQNKMSELNELIDDKRNIQQQVKFNFNHIVLKAIETASHETNNKIKFTKQFGDLATVKGSPIDLFQVLMKLFRQAGRSYEEGNEIILVKTWKTEEYANMLINIPSKANTYFSDESLVVINKLIKENKGKFKFQQQKDGLGVVWISFPY